MSNPGTMLVSLEEYFEGGHSVCRNPLLQKMFIFLGIGEKGGSGADVIVKGWKDNGWETPSITEKQNPDRVETILSVSFPGQGNGIADKLLINKENADKMPIKKIIADKLSLNKEIVDKYKTNDAFIDKMAEIIIFLKNSPHSSTAAVSRVVSKSISRTKNYLHALVELKLIVAEGVNKNRSYSLVGTD